ncbi:MAG: large subunit ribosomal protein [Candidatus Sumerlaeota bacterium]|nr:large subunit ribosomal protein [Candidatus Sumerlaeota bacterium]
MKVILFRSVDGLGSAGQVVDVKRGYHRNYLAPRGYAREASRANLALMESRRKKIEAMVARERAVAAESAGELTGIKLTFEMRANDKGQLFGSVTSQDIAKALAEKGLKVDRRKIELAEHIKSLGTFPFRIRLYPGVYADLEVIVERFLRPEEREAMEEAAAAAAEAETARAEKDAPEAAEAAAGEASAEEAPSEEAAAEEAPAEAEEAAKEE